MYRGVLTLAQVEIGPWHALSTFVVPNLFYTLYVAKLAAANFHYLCGRNGFLSFAWQDLNYRPISVLKIYAKCRYIFHVLWNKFGATIVNRTCHELISPCTKAETPLHRMSLRIFSTMKTFKIWPNFHLIFEVLMMTIQYQFRDTYDFESVASHSLHEWRPSPVYDTHQREF